MRDGTPSTYQQYKDGNATKRSWPGKGCPIHCFLQFWAPVLGLVGFTTWKFQTETLARTRGTTPWDEQLRIKCSPAGRNEQRQG